MTEQWEPCPRCGSKRVEKTTARKLIIFSTIMIAAAVLEPGLLWFFALGIGAWGYVEGKKLGHLNCKDCGNIWKLEETKSVT